MYYYYYHHYSSKAACKTFPSVLVLIFPVAASFSSSVYSSSNVYCQVPLPHFGRGAGLSLATGTGSDWPKSA